MTDIYCYKLNWKRGKGSQDTILSNMPNGNICIAFHNKKYGRGWTHTEPNYLINLISKNRNIFEVLSTYPKKVYFDVDFNNPPEDFNQDDFLNNLFISINEFFPNINFAISGSVSPDKASFHLVATNYIINNEEELDNMKLIAKALFLKNPSVDKNVYTKNRQMKLPNQSKPDKNIQSVITNDDLKQHVITAFFNNDYLPFPCIHNLKEENIIDIDISSKNTLKSINITTLNLPNPDNITWDELLYPENADKLLALIPTGKEFDHSHSYRVCNFCVNNNIPKAMFLKWLSQKNPDDKNRLYKYSSIHWDAITKYCKHNKDYVVSQYKMRSLLPNWYPDIKPKDANFKNFKNNWFLPNNLITFVDAFDINHFNVKQKFIFCSNPMGFGKTNTIIQFLANDINTEFCWLAPRITLVDDTYERMINNGVKATHYNNLGNKKNKEFVIKFKEKTPNLILCLNSLHYIFDRDFFPDIVIIDEIETILSVLCSVDNKFLSIETKTIILRTLKNIINNAKKVICLDAFTTMRTLNFISSITNDTIFDNNNCIIYDTPKPKKKIRDIIQLKNDYDDKNNDDDDIINHIANNLCNGDKIILFYPFKKGNDNFKSMENYLAVISNLCIKKGYTGNVNKDFVCYNGDTSQHIKKHIKDVNTFWQEKKLVVFNNVITAGVSYSNITSSFDKVYLLVAGFNTPRDIAQVSYRARVLTSNTIYISYFKTRQKEAWETDVEYINLPYYTNLFNDSLKEFKSPLKKTIMLFFKRANYNINHPIQKMVFEENDRHNNDAEIINIYAYNSINDINDNGFQDICKRQFTENNIHTDEILSARKYVFKSHFNPNTPKEILSKIWDFDSYNIIKLYNENSKNPNSFETIIAKDNGWRYFPYIEKKTRKFDVIISDEAKEILFKEWDFLRFNKNTKQTNKLLTTFYNTKYHTQIIDEDRDYKNNMTFYSTDELKHDELNELLDYAEEYYYGPPVN